MPIVLKDFNKTEFQGLYISKKSYGEKGNKYIGRFQVNNKKYMKVLGYSHSNHMNNLKAYELLNDYQDNILHSTKQSNHYHLIPQSDAYIVIDDNELVIDDLIEDYKRMKDIVNDFFPLVDNSDEFFENIQEIYKLELLKQYEVEFSKVQTYLSNHNKKILVSIYSKFYNIISAKALIFKDLNDYLPFLPSVGKIGIFDHEVENFENLSQIDTLLIECNIDQVDDTEGLSKVNALKEILKNIDYDLKNRRLNF
jgi:hypothetical protein